MTEDMMRLRGLAVRMVPEDAIGEDESGFALALPEASLSFFSTGGHSAAAYCRACVAELGEGSLPQSFVEAALRGNFFWRGTDGATLSFNAAGNSVWLTDRFDEGAIRSGDAARN